jgi:hypothetical protein
MIRFLAEISLRAEADINPTPSNEIPRNNNIYEIDIRQHPKEGYWIDRDGWHDTYAGTQIELYYGQFLQHANTYEELLAIPYSLWINERFVYINIPKYPWLYPYYSAEGENVLPVLSAALDPDNPSRNTIRSVAAPVRLAVPNFTVKLSDNISGITLNQGFSLQFINNDGYFDDDDTWDLFNTPSAGRGFSRICTRKTPR